jgi:hypothetical protein
MYSKITLLFKLQVKSILLEEDKNLNYLRNYLFNHQN